ncbi:hypothetical protein HMI54_015318 [Coelomomyces lativittatus]|nr:hypothetical protein HMI54_015318 [Coelomomyces lativittatus]
MLYLDLDSNAIVFRIRFTQRVPDKFRCSIFGNLTFNHLVEERKLEEILNTRLLLGVCDELDCSFDMTTYFVQKKIYGFHDMNQFHNTIMMFNFHCDDHRKSIPKTMFDLNIPLKIKIKQPLPLLPHILQEFLDSSYDTSSDQAISEFIAIKIDDDGLEDKQFFGSRPRCKTSNNTPPVCKMVPYFLKKGQFSNQMVSNEKRESISLGPKPEPSACNTFPSSSFIEEVLISGVNTIKFSASSSTTLNQPVTLTLDDAKMYFKFRAKAEVDSKFKCHVKGNFHLRTLREIDNAFWHLRNQVAFLQCNEDCESEILVYFFNERLGHLNNLEQLNDNELLLKIKCEATNGELQFPPFYLYTKLLIKALSPKSFYSEALLPLLKEPYFPTPSKMALPQYAALKIAKTSLKSPKKVFGLKPSCPSKSSLENICTFNPIYFSASDFVILDTNPAKVNQVPSETMEDTFVEGPEVSSNAIRNIEMS